MFPLLLFLNLIGLSIVLKFVSLILEVIYHIISAINLDLFTIFSKIDGSDSSSSGLHKNSPIYASVKPDRAAFYSRVPVILIFLRQISLNLKVFSRSLISFFIFNDLMNFKVFSEKGSLAYFQDNQQRS